MFLLRSPRLSADWLLRVCWCKKRFAAKCRQRDNCRELTEVAAQIIARRSSTCAAPAKAAHVYTQRLTPAECQPAASAVTHRRCHSFSPPPLSICFPISFPPTLFLFVLTLPSLILHRPFLSVALHCSPTLLPYLGVFLSE